MKYHSNFILLLFQCQVLFCWEFISFRNIEWTRIFSFVWMVWLFDICSSNGFSCGWNRLPTNQSRSCLWKDTESSSPWRNEDAFEVFERYNFKVYLIESRSQARHKQRFYIYMRLWQNSEEKICICYSSHLGSCIKPNSFK